MGDENLLLDHARRYFTQAGQTSDMKKIKMLAELGLEFVRLAQHGERSRPRAGGATESTGTAPAAAVDEGDTGKGDG
jgi:hypothetical protein